MIATRPSIPVVVQQHVEQAALLRNTRSFLASAPHVKLIQLRRLDDRMAAYLDGVAVAGEPGSTLATAALVRPGCGEVFTAAVRAIEDRDAVGLERLLALVEASEGGGRSGLVSAFGWVSAASLRGITKALLESPHAFRRQVGLAACSMHQVDPGRSARGALNDADAGVRIRALRVVADRGLVDFLPACANALADEDPACVSEAALAAVLLGDRGASLARLRLIAAEPGPSRGGALDLALKLGSLPETHALLKVLSQDPANVRWLIRGIGVGGDPHYVPWLIHQMADQKLARLAGESFSLITGLDLALLDLERKSAEDAATGPDDNPANDDVAMEEDLGLPWPDPEKISSWWQANGHRFAAGTRYFMGQPPSPAHCLSILKSGFQRQRMAAAIYLCLLQPGTPLFNTAAPAWRQERWLNAMGA